MNEFAEFQANPLYKRISGNPIIQKNFRQSHYTKEFDAITLYRKNFMQSHYTERISCNHIIPKEFQAIPLYERISGNLVLQKNQHLEFLLQFQSKYSEREKWELLPI
jgi:hypothetical protein